MHKRKTKSKAFTVIELVIVIIVIGILFVAFLSKTDNTTDKAKLAGVETDFRTFYTATKQAGLESQLWLLTEEEFEEKLNDNLDIPMQFKDGVCTEEDPWGENYVYKTKVDKVAQTFYITFASKGGNDRIVLSVDDIVYADDDSDFNITMSFKQYQTEFSAMDTKGADKDVSEEIWNAINDEFGLTYGEGGSGSGSDKYPPDPNLPEEAPEGTLVSINTYSWAELKAISNEVQSGRKTPADYGIDVANQTKNQLTKDGFVLVDMGTDPDDSYDGFVFMGNIDVCCKMNSSTDSNLGGYNSSQIKSLLEDYYNGEMTFTDPYNAVKTRSINPEIKTVIKPVIIISNAGKENYDLGIKVYQSENVHLFLPSLKELGRDYSDTRFYNGIDALDMEGNTFDYYKNGGGFSGSHSQIQTGYSNQLIMYTRSAYLKHNLYYYMINYNGTISSGNGARGMYPCFVI